MMAVLCTAQVCHTAPPSASAAAAAGERLVRRSGPADASAVLSAAALPRCFSAFALPAAECHRGLDDGEAALRCPRDDGDSGCARPAGHVTRMDASNPGHRRVRCSRLALDRLSRPCPDHRRTHLGRSRGSRPSSGRPAPPRRPSGPGTGRSSPRPGDVRVHRCTPTMPTSSAVGSLIGAARPRTGRRPGRRSGFAVTFLTSSHRGVVGIWARRTVCSRPESLRE